MFITADRGNRSHAPENSRNALLSGYVAGAEGIRLPVRLTKDDRLVVVQDDDLKRLTGVSAKVSELSLKDIRKLDLGATFVEADGTPFSYRTRVDTFALLLDVLPPDVWLIIEILSDQPLTGARRKKLVSGVVDAAANRGVLSRLVVYSTDAKIVASASESGAATATYQPELSVAQQITAAAEAEAEAVVLPLSSVVGPNGSLTESSRKLAKYVNKGKIKRGAILLSDNSVTPEQYSALVDAGFAWTLLTDSVHRAANLFRPGWRWVDEKWEQTAEAHEDVNTDLWHLGYAKFNPEKYCHVYLDNGIHVVIKPFEGEAKYTATGDQLKTRCTIFLSDHGTSKRTGRSTRAAAWVSSWESPETSPQKWTYSAKTSHKRQPSKWPR